MYYRSRWVERKTDQFLSAQRSIFELGVFHYPFEGLEMVYESIPRRVKHKLLASLREKVSVQSVGGQQALNLLTWSSLPQLGNLLPAFRELGVSDEELIEKGLLLLPEIVLDWNPAGVDGKRNYLSLHVATRVRHKLTEFVSNRYGLGMTHPPVVQTYFRSRRLFNSYYGREPGMDDLAELRRIAFEEWLWQARREGPKMLSRQGLSVEDLAEAIRGGVIK